MVVYTVVYSCCCNRAKSHALPLLSSLQACLIHLPVARKILEGTVGMTKYLQLLPIHAPLLLPQGCPKPNKNRSSGVSCPRSVAINGESSTFDNTTRDGKAYLAQTCLCALGFQSDQILSAF